ncbi:tetratricopeptide repeat protein [bacterium]|nr:tetratricopeptide repeat protein [candidate division CSSED10-310 bacterium]
MNRWNHLHLRFADHCKSDVSARSVEDFDRLLLELEVLLIEDEQLHQQKDIDKTLDCLKYLLDVCKWKSGSAREIRAFVRIARWSDRRGFPETAGRAYERVLNLADASGDRELHIQSLEELGDIYRRKGNFDQAVTFQQKAAQLASNGFSPELEAHALNNLGVISIETGRLEEAETYLHKAIECLQVMWEPLLEGHIYNNLGVIYCIKGQPDAGCMEFQRALFCRDQAKDRNGFAETIHNLGLTFVEMNRLDDAEDYLDRALVIARELGRLQSIGNILLAKSELFLRKRDVVIGRRLAQEAMKSLRQMDDSLGVADAMRLMAEAEFQDGNLKHARHAVLDALKLNQQCSHLMGQAQCNELLYKIAIRRNNYDEAECSRKRAIELWLMLGNETAASRLQ